MDDDRDALAKAAARERQDFEERVFDLAYFWRMSPAEIMALPMCRFLQFERHAVRIAEKQRPDDG
ncbi:hypothetical protein [Paraburkholderia terrae]|uniref:hypothetical protein n=1 Tax=Paraburkholderia terrae TaxID=311230 RepID=UPI001EE20FAF|nr:hypothetical protein [Paraburkholderia terrae]GJH05037.1 hypothetical protein CBA19C8_30790 [Paraburkholderia terrae]